MTVYATSEPDPIWGLLFAVAIGAPIVGRLARGRLGPVAARLLLVAGGLLLAAVVGYSLLVTWLLPLPGAPT